MWTGVHNPVNIVIADRIDFLFQIKFIKYPFLSIHRDTLQNDNYKDCIFSELQYFDTSCYYGLLTNITLKRNIYIMNIGNLGLLLNFFGTVLLGVSSQFGSATGWGGPIAWKNTCWQRFNCLGWILLALGFFIQLFAGYQP